MLCRLDASFYSGYAALSGRVKTVPESTIEAMKETAADNRPDKIDISKVMEMRKQRGGKKPAGLKVSYLSGYANMDDERKR